MNIDQARIHYLKEHCGYTEEDAKRFADEVVLCEESLEDAAKEFFDILYSEYINDDAKSYILPYIDYSLFAAHCYNRGELFDFEFKDKTYTVKNW